MIDVQWAIQRCNKLSWIFKSKLKNDEKNDTFICIFKLLKVCFFTFIIANNYFFYMDTKKIYLYMLFEIYVFVGI